MLLAHVKRIGVVLQSLAHLLAICSKNEAVHYQVLEWRPVEEVCRQHHQSVEPSSRLIQPLCNKVRWETLLKVLLLLEWIVLLRVGHGSTFEPAIKNLIHPPEHSLALL